MSRPSRGGVTLLRTLPHSSPIHRLWAGTKLLSVGLLAVGLSLEPTWAGIGLVAAVVVLVGFLARVPLSAVPRPPLWFWGVILFGAVLMVRAGGSPYVHTGRVTVGLGGVEGYAQFFCLGVDLFLASALVGWTTPLADVAPALARLGRPLAWLRLPVEEWAVAVALCARCLPLLIDELRTLAAARRLREHPDRPSGAPQGDKEVPLHSKAVNALLEVGELLIAVLAVSLRRAGEMGEAIVARGGAHFEPAPATLRWSDRVTVLAAVVITATTIAIPFVVGS